ncbi:Protein transport protein [Yarrowia sp. E02]|nr:Protein transport protein [Yarrowia sp. E02]
MASPTRSDDPDRRRSPSHDAPNVLAAPTGPSVLFKDSVQLARANTDEVNVAVPTISLTSPDGRRSASASRTSTSTLTNLGHTLRRTVSPSKAPPEEQTKDKDRERSFSLGFNKKKDTDGPRGRLQFRSNSSSTVASLLGFAKFRKDKEEGSSSTPSRSQTPTQTPGTQTHTPTQSPPTSAAAGTQLPLIPSLQAGGNSLLSDTDSDNESVGSRRRGVSVSSTTGSMAQLGAHNYSQWSQSLKVGGTNSTGGSTGGSHSGGVHSAPPTRSSTGSVTALLEEEPKAKTTTRRPSTPNLSSSNSSLMPPPAPTGFARFRRKTASMLFNSDDEEPTRPPVFRSLSSQSIGADRQKEKEKEKEKEKDDKEASSGGSTSGTLDSSLPSLEKPRSESVSAVSAVSRTSTISNQFLTTPSASTFPNSPSLSFQDLPFASRPRSKTMPSSGGPPSAPSAEKVLDSSKSASYSPRESVEDIQLPPINDRSPAEYMAAIRQLNMHGQTAALLCNRDSDFYRECMAIYSSEFDFTMDPIDMALRKFLMYVVLPKEAQQIDRILDAFATRYDECNPGIYADAELAYVVAFSLMILHTDSFNKSNKHKMQKSDYINNTFAEGVSPDILECFYDNITYTPFVHTEEEPGHDKKTLVAQKKTSSFNIRSDKNLIDPYALILEGKLDSIRPSLDDALSQDCPYSYEAPETREAFHAVRLAFSNGASLQLTSSRSRPGAFLTQDTTDNPLMADPGVIDIKIAKVGILYRKEQKRVLSTARSIWKEWGAILTASQLYLFKETQWIKSILKDLEAGRHVISANDQFHPTITLSTTGMVALRNSSTSAPPKTSRKVPFVLSAKSLGQEWIAAGSENDTAEWTHLINYSAAFANHSINPNPGTGINSSLTAALSQDIHTSRRLAMVDALHTLDEKVAAVEVEVDTLLRNARHLKLMAPIQQRTRYHVNFCAARLSAKLDWQWLDLTKYQSYRRVLTKELEEEQEWQLTGGAETAEEADKEEGKLEPVQSTTLSIASSSSAVLSGFPKMEITSTSSEEDDDDEGDSDESQETSDSYISSLSPSHAQSSPSQAVDFPLSEASPDSPEFENFEECLPVKSGRNSFLSTNTAIARPDSSLSSRSSLHPTASNGSKHDRFYEVRESILRDTAPSDRSDGDTRSSSLDLPRRPSRSLSLSRSSGDLRSAEGSPLKPSMSMRKLRTSLRNGSSSPGREASPARDPSPSVERSSSLLRGSDFTLHGKKFSVVEVNPQFAATPHHKRTASRSERKEEKKGESELQG